MADETEQEEGKPIDARAVAVALDAAGAVGLKPNELTQDQAVEILKIINPESIWTPEMLRAVDQLGGLLTVKTTAKMGMAVQLEGLGHIQAVTKVCADIAKFTKKENVAISATLAVAACIKNMAELTKQMTENARVTSEDSSNKTRGMNAPPDFSAPQTQTNISVTIQGGEQPKAESGVVEVSSKRIESTDG